MGIESVESGEVNNVIVLLLEFESDHMKEKISLPAEGVVK